MRFWSYLKRFIKLLLVSNFVVHVLKRAHISEKDINLLNLELTYGSSTSVILLNPDEIKDELNYFSPFLPMQDILDGEIPDGTSKYSVNIVFLRGNLYNVSKVLEDRKYYLSGYQQRVFSCLS